MPTIVPIVRMCCFRRFLAYHGKGEEETIMRILRVAILIVGAALWSAPSHSQTGSSQAEWINAMRQGGYVIVLRHGATPTDQADTDPLHLENVAQQRQLNDQGRQQARTMGAAMRKLDIPVG